MAIKWGTDSIGIAEGHAVAMAAGMAKQGAIPVFAVYSSFLQRAYAEAAELVAQLPLKGIGEDCISIDPCDSVDFSNHITLLGRGLVNTENLKNLDKLIGRTFTFVTLPLKFENADGCSCRAVAILDYQKL